MSELARDFPDDWQERIESGNIPLRTTHRRPLYGSYDLSLAGPPEDYDGEEPEPDGIALNQEIDRRRERDW